MFGVIGEYWWIPGEMSALTCACDTVRTAATQTADSNLRCSHGDFILRQPLLRRIRRFRDGMFLDAKRDGSGKRRPLAVTRAKCPDGSPHDQHARDALAR